MPIMTIASSMGESPSVKVGNEKEQPPRRMTALTGNKWMQAYLQASEGDLVILKRGVCFGLASAIAIAIPTQELHPVSHDFKGRTH